MGDLPYLSSGSGSRSRCSSCIVSFCSCSSNFRSIVLFVIASSVVVISQHPLFWKTGTCPRILREKKSCHKSIVNFAFQAVPAFTLAGINYNIKTGVLSQLR